MPQFDPTKPVRTRDGRKARIIASDRQSNNQTIVALVEIAEGREAVVTYFPNGNVNFTGENNYDLINTTERTTQWVNMYPSTFGQRHNTRESSDRNRALDCIGTLELIYEDGKIVEAKVVTE